MEALKQAAIEEGQWSEKRQLSDSQASSVLAARRAAGRTRRAFTDTSHHLMDPARYRALYLGPVPSGPRRRPGNMRSRISRAMTSSGA